MTRDADAGLRAVRRVRSAREEDSRRGLARAAAEHEAHRSHVAALEELVQRRLAPLVCSPAELLRARGDAEALRGALAEARADLSASRTVAEAAREHWHQDRSSLRAVEIVLERRAEARREKARRTEARESDQTATDLWLRGRTHEDAS